MLLWAVKLGVADYYKGTSACNARMQFVYMQHRLEMNGYTLLLCTTPAAARSHVMQQIQQWHICSGTQPQHAGMHGAVYIGGMNADMSSACMLPETQGLCPL